MGLIVESVYVGLKGVFVGVVYLWLCMCVGNSVELVFCVLLSCKRFSM